jgi:hypothetical protein
MCLSYPTEPVRFKLEEMEQLPSDNGMCRFCREGKDINGGYKYGQKWEDSERFD